MFVLLGFPICKRTCHIKTVNVHLKNCFFWYMLGKNTMFIMLLSNMVELRGIEPRTPCLQSRCSPSWAIAPNIWVIFGGQKNHNVSYGLLYSGNWWVWVDLNHRPHPYQGCALTNWATDPVFMARSAPSRLRTIINFKSLMITFFI